MVFKKLIKKIKSIKISNSSKSNKKVSNKKSKLTLKKTAKQKYPNRFLKFYHLNRDRLIEERKSIYSEKKKKGICVRCNRKSVSGIVFCKYHQKKQKGYNKKARNK
jgi:hypothetical protein